MLILVGVVGPEKDDTIFFLIIFDGYKQNKIKKLKFLFLFHVYQPFCLLEHALRSIFFYCFCLRFTYRSHVAQKLRINFCVTSCQQNSSNYSAHGYQLSRVFHVDKNKPQV